MKKETKIVIVIVVIALVAVIGIRVYKTTKSDEKKAKQEISLEKKPIVNEVKGTTEKDNYLNELANLENSTSDLENGNISEQKEVAEKWNDELNKIYKVVDNKLAGSNKTKFENDEKEWDVSKNDSITEATQMIMKKETDIKMTKERCYYLVNQYMK